MDERRVEAIMRAVERTGHLGEFRARSAVENRHEIVEAKRRKRRSTP